MFFNPNRTANLQRKRNLTLLRDQVKRSITEEVFYTKMHNLIKNTQDDTIITEFSDVNEGIFLRIFCKLTKDGSGLNSRTRQVGFMISDISDKPVPNKTENETLQQYYDKCFARYLTDLFFKGKLFIPLNYERLFTHVQL